MRVRSLGRKYSAHLPQKKNKLLFKRVFGSDCCYPFGRFFFSFRVDRLGISRWLPLPCRRSVPGCGRMSWCHVVGWWKEWGNHGDSEDMKLLLHPWWLLFIPFTQDDVAIWFFATNNNPVGKKNLRRSFFLMCVYLFSPGCPFVSFWFLKKLRPHFFFAARKIAGIFGLLESSAWGYKGAIGKTNRHPYYSGESSCT